MHASDHDQTVGSVSAAIVTVSDTRTPQTDESGRLLRDLLAAAGHAVAAQEIVPDVPARIEECLHRLAERPDVQVIIFVGGTGISSRDTTFEALEGQLDRQLPGFGELFRQLSFAEIGSRAMLSRALAGTYRGTLVFSIPGSPHAARLAAEKLILPDLGHAVWLLTR